MTTQEYEHKIADSQLVTIDGKTWRLTLCGGGVKWQSAEEHTPKAHTKQGQVDGCGLAEPPACPTLEDEGDMEEQTMADNQISMEHRVHIRQEILENRPDQEPKHNTIRTRAKTTDDLEPGQSFSLLSPRIREGGEAIQTKIMSAGKPQQKKDLQERNRGHKAATQVIQAQQAFLADSRIHAKIELLVEETIEAGRYRTCNTEHFWTAKMEDAWLASALYQLGYSHQEIVAKGPPSSSGPRNGETDTPCRRSPRRTCRA